MVRDAPRRRGLSEADESAWTAYTRLIVPLPGRTLNNESGSPPPAPEPRETQNAGAKVRAVARPSRQPEDPLAVGGQPAGLDKATWQRLKSGKLGTQRTLDLHGMTVQHAYISLAGFLRRAQADRLRCVEIITGRGSGETGGAIRRELPYWLNRPDIRPLVLGAAHPHELNPGSVRLLLRRPR